MEYREFCGERISLLGMGNMRLPVIPGGARGDIDKEKALAIIDRVYRAGVNYFDTAYMYHDGASETFLGEALKRYPRDSFYLADKMPGMVFIREPGTPERVKEIFDEQLRRCQTDHFDFYLLHNVAARTIPVYTDEGLGIVPFLQRMKAEGKIRHLGFSSHSSPDDLRAFLDSFPEGTFEFVQIQCNYLDWELQHADEQYEIITSHGLPVWVMEPCRGGRLASLHPDADAILKEAEPDRSIASWAFRFVGSLPEVGVVLSGMTAAEQAEDNLATFGDFRPLDGEEKKVLDSALDIMKKRLIVPCTGCRYCDVCPAGLDIPGLLARYNRWKLDGGRGELRGIMKLAPGAQPSACLGCGACADVCPQSIGIPAIMSEMAGVIAEMEAIERK